MSVCRSRHWACAHCGHAIVDHLDAWTIEFATRPWIHVVHDECLDAYNAASVTPPTFDTHIIDIDAEMPRSVELDALLATVPRNEPTVCAGTGNHDGQGITDCDECVATFDLDAMERDPLLHP